jgi:hypothetical protein
MTVLTPQPSLLQKFRFFLFMRKWKRSALGQALAEHTRRFFYTESKLRFFEEATKEKLIAEFHQQIFLLPSDPNPFLKFREHLTNSVIGYASLQVLCLKPVEKKQSFYSNAHYISAELHEHIRACAEHNAELKQLLWENPEMSDGDLVDAANTRSTLWLYYANGLNLVRSEFGETLIKGKDWFRPYVASAMVFEEETYRRKIGMPSLMSHGDELLPLEHSTFMTWVVEGEQNPLYAWESHFDRIHSDSI